MTLPQVEAAVEDLRHAHRELLGVVDALSDAGWQRYVPYGEWTVKDMVAHVIGDMSPSGPGLIHAGVLTPAQRAAYERLRGWRKVAAAARRVDASLILPRPVMHLLAQSRHVPKDLEALAAMWRERLTAEGGRPY